MITDFLTDEEIRELGLAAAGHHIAISRHALIIGASDIRIGSYTRIDAFAVLSASSKGIAIGRNVHVSASCTLLGQECIEIGDFSTISVRCSLFSSSDDYSGHTMTNPTVSDEYRGCHDAPVCIGRHVILGAGCVVLPGVTIGHSAALGAMTLAREDIPESTLAAGIPARVIGSRSDRHIDLANYYITLD